MGHVGTAMKETASASSVWPLVSVWLGSQRQACRPRADADGTQNNLANVPHTRGWHNAEALHAPALTRMQPFVVHADARLGKVGDGSVVRACDVEQRPPVLRKQQQQRRQDGLLVPCMLGTITTQRGHMRGRGTQRRMRQQRCARHCRRRRPLLTPNSSCKSGLMVSSRDSSQSSSESASSLSHAPLLEA